MKMKGEDICECGHRRDEHNNRIKSGYVSQMKYNCCMVDLFCDCVKFRISAQNCKEEENGDN